MNVAFYGLLGQIQFDGDFLVGETSADQRHQLPFAPSQSELFRDPTAMNIIPARCHIVEKHSGQMGRADRFALCDAAYRCDDVQRRCLLQNVAEHAVANRGQELLWVVLHGH